MPDYSRKEYLIFRHLTPPYSYLKSPQWQTPGTLFIHGPVQFKLGYLHYSGQWQHANRGD